MEYRGCGSLSNYPYIDNKFFIYVMFVQYVAYCSYSVNHPLSRGPDYCGPMRWGLL